MYFSGKCSVIATVIIVFPDFFTPQRPHSCSSRDKYAEKRLERVINEECRERPTFSPFSFFSCFQLLAPFFFSGEPSAEGQLRSFSNDTGNSNEKVKKEKKSTMGFIIKTTTSHVHFTFLYISLPSLSRVMVLWRT